MEKKAVPLSKVELWDKNPRNIKTKDFERLKRQILKLGVYKPLICVKEGRRFIILGGNMRFKALQALNYSDVDISIVKAPTEALKIEYALSDNDRAGEYDEDKLAELVYPHIEEIKLSDYKMDLRDPVSLKELIEDYGPSEDDSENDVLEYLDEFPPVTKSGEMFQLGKHKLLCGDFTKKEDVAKLMGEKKADMVFIDPPCDYKMDPFDLCFKYCEKDIFIMHSDRRFLPIFKKHGDKFKEYFVVHHRQPFWIRTNLVPIRYHILIGHFAGKKAKRKKLRIGTVIELGSMYSRERDFFQAKKIEIMEPFIINYSHEKDIIVDFFAGSGSTLMACHKYRRISYNLEIDPKMCDMIIKRFSKHSGINEKEIRGN